MQPKSLFGSEVVELQYSDAGSSRELAQLVGMNIDRNIRRAEVIGQQEVARWLDENELLEYPELGKALDADIVIGIASAPMRAQASSKRSSWLAICSSHMWYLL